MQTHPVDIDPKLFVRWLSAEYQAVSQIHLEAARGQKRRSRLLGASRE
jgi:hypothetical protein